MRPRSPSIFATSEIREVLSRVAELFEINLVIPDTLRGQGFGHAAAT
jgi:hypothetical protein